MTKIAGARHRVLDNICVKAQGSVLEHNPGGRQTRKRGLRKEGECLSSGSTVRHLSAHETMKDRKGRGGSGQQMLFGCPVLELLN